MTIRSAEHFVRPVQRWSCAAAPIHDPATRRILGVVDVTGGDDIGSPQTIAMIRAAARMAEAELAGSPVRRPWAVRRGAVAAAGRAPPAACTCRRSAGPTWCVAAGGRSLRLSPRHSEILACWPAAPTGCPATSWRHAVPGDVSPATLRAEMVRLRALLGADVLASRPYRLTCEVTSRLGRRRGRWRPATSPPALTLYRGPLLPPSEAPGVVRLRGDLHGWLRAVILADGGHELLVELDPDPRGAPTTCRCGSGQCALLPPLAAAAAGRGAASALDAELGR